MSVAPSHKGWDVSVYGTGLSKPLGQLIYTPAGELLPYRSTSFEMMRNVAMEAFANP